jgi:ATP-binding cassette subfamily C protein
MKKDLAKLYRLLTPSERRKGILVALVTVVGAGLQGAAAASLFPFLNAVTDSSSIESGRIGFLYDQVSYLTYEEFLLGLGLGVLGLVIVSNAALAFGQWIRLRYQWDVHHNLSVRLMSKYLGRDYSYYLDKNTAEMNRNLLNEAQTVTGSLLRPILRMTSSLSIAVAMLGTMIFIDPISTSIVLLLTGGGYAVAYLLIRRKLEKIGMAYAKSNQERFEVTAEAFGGIKETKLLGREKHFLDAYREPSQQFSSSLAAKQVYGVMPKYVIEALVIGSLLSVLIFLLASGQSVSAVVPIMGVFAFAGYRMMPAFRDGLDALTSFRFTEEIVGTLEEAMETKTRDATSPVEQPPAAGEIQPLSLEEEIHLDGVSFGYPTANELAVRDINIRIPKGSEVAFVGETGAGKTTVINLLLGLLEPTTGCLRVDGEVIEDRNLRGWQDLLGYVPQDIFLADATIRENIAFGIPEEEIDDEAVQSAADIAQISSFIEQALDEGYETVVGEDGVRLSGGQRQRLGIARALYHDPEVIVFDEATSDIDGVTEANITAAIDNLDEEKTVITIAHRINTIEDADRIFMIHDGEIACSGDYAELAKQSSRFRSMVSEQTLSLES